MASISRLRRTSASGLPLPSLDSAPAGAANSPKDAVGGAVVDGGGEKSSSPAAESPTAVPLGKAGAAPAAEEGCCVVQ